MEETEGPQVVGEHGRSTAATGGLTIGMLIENADLRAAIKHLGHNPVTFINRAKRKRERDDE
jgi:hypothetical protein